MPVSDRPDGRCSAGVRGGPRWSRSATLGKADNPMVTPGPGDQAIGKRPMVLSIQQYQALIVKNSIKSITPINQITGAMPGDCPLPIKPVRRAAADQANQSGIALVTFRDIPAFHAGRLNSPHKCNNGNLSLQTYRSNDTDLHIHCFSGRHSVMIHSIDLLNRSFLSNRPRYRMPSTAGRSVILMMSSDSTMPLNLVLVK